MLVIADLHLGDISDSILQESGLPSKVEDTVARVKEVIEVAGKTQQSVVFAGDVFDNAHPEPHIIAALFSLFVFASELGVQVWIIPGNHDSTSRLESLIVAKAANYSNVKVVSKPWKATIDNVACFLLPHIRKVDEAELFAKAEVSSYEELLKKAKVENRYVLSHAQLVEASALSSEQSMEAGNAMVFSIRKLPKMKGMVLGHIHTHQIIQHPKYEYEIVYPGSLVPHSFKEGEDSAVGKCYVEISESGISVHPYTAAMHEYKTINLKVKSTFTKDTIPDEKLQKLSGKLLKLRVRAASRDLVDETILRSVFNKYAVVMRVEYIFEDKEGEVVELDTVDSIHESLNYAALLTQYLKEKVKDPEIRKRTLALGKELIQGAGL